MDTLPLENLPTGERIRLLRMYAGLTVPEVALRWEMSTQYVYAVEGGTATPKRLQIEDIEQAAREAAKRRGIVIPPSGRPSALANGDVDGLASGDLHVERAGAQAKRARRRGRPEPDQPPAE